ncbi:hypothetical protein BCE75_112101 [Isoptericola sp. CG 20/1183]|uniref:Lipoprotein n=1 Tax=Isoptericola halotolerans TaxID=300560 RepID=A0ABX5EDA4_9MICO|nr:hypothetical protein BCE75_112101 [Isoptericola sp. CG 20/1183]PRZ03985.1 hypothetical protein BCL65_11119 [Isoptericola halotolerans]
MGTRYRDPVPTTRHHRVPRRTACAVLALCVITVSGCDAGPAGRAAPTDATAAATGTGPEGAPTALPSFDPGTAVGGYAPGFPTDLLGAPEGSTVLASSATPAEGDLVDVSLNLSTELSTQEVVDRYAERLGEAGFDESEDVDVSALTVQTAYTRTKGKKKPRVETVLIGVLDESDRRLVSLSGSVRAQDA